MTDKPNRRFWPIHLSTAVVLMFVAGTLLWANLNPRLRIVAIDTCVERNVSLGWPFTAYHNVELRQIDILNDVKMDKVLTFKNDDRLEYYFATGIESGKLENWNSKEIIFNLALLVLACIVTASIFETFIRRREARKP